MRTDAGSLVELPDSYLAGRRHDGRAFLEHGHAITTARAQGATWQRSYVLADPGTYQQEAYTQLSRHTVQVRSTSSPPTSSPTIPPQTSSSAPKPPRTRSPRWDER